MGFGSKTRVSKRSSIQRMKGGSSLLPTNSHMKKGQYWVLGGFDRFANVAKYFGVSKVQGSLFEWTYKLGFGCNRR